MPSSVMIQEERSDAGVTRIKMALDCDSRSRTCRRPKRLVRNRQTSRSPRHAGVERCLSRQRILEQHSILAVHVRGEQIILFRSQRPLDPGDILGQVAQYLKLV